MWWEGKDRGAKDAFRVSRDGGRLASFSLCTRLSKQSPWPEEWSAMAEQRRSVVRKLQSREADYVTPAARFTKRTSVLEPLGKGPEGNDVREWCEGFGLGDGQEGGAEEDVCETFEQDSLSYRLSQAKLAGPEAGTSPARCWSHCNQGPPAWLDVCHVTQRPCPRWSPSTRV